MCYNVKIMLRRKIPGTLHGCFCRWADGVPDSLGVAQIKAARHCVYTCDPVDLYLVLKVGLFMKRLFLVMNPYAGTRKANRVLPEIIRLFNSKNYDVVVHMTAGTGDGARVVEARAGEMDLIVCAGGDGTFNEVIMGLMRSGLDRPVGYIPCGSTNDFANSLHLPLDPLEAAAQITVGEPSRYDVGRFADRYFSYVASFGAFTKTSYSTPQNVKNALGHTAYLLAGMKELFQIPKEHVAFETDQGSFEGEYIFGAVSNSTSVGGILTLDPNVVDMQDGKFELMLVRPPRDPVELLNLVSALSSQKYVSPMLTFRTVSRLKVTASPSMVWTLDGERAECPGEFEIENLQHAIHIIRGA